MEMGFHTPKSSSYIQEEGEGKGGEGREVEVKNWQGRIEE